MTNFVRAGSKVADIGADHGYLSVELAESKRAIKVIATEKNIHPFEALNKNISESGFGNLIETRLGDGLKVLSAGEVDTICIAGMGGALIANILDESPEVVKSARRLILQPMNAAKKIREWLAENDWLIFDEDLAESGGIIYEIICADKESVQEEFSRDKSELRKKFLIQRLKKLEKVVSEMEKSDSARKTEKYFELKNEKLSLENKIGFGRD